jgi:hypothetical protein
MRNANKFILGWKKLRDVQKDELGICECTILELMLGK